MEKLGIQLPLLISQIVNFTILIFILNKLLYKPILSALKKRKTEIEESLAFSEKVKKEVEVLEEKRKTIIQQSQKEAHTILEEARKSGRGLKDELVKEGKVELEQLKNRIEKELQVKEEELTKSITSHTVEIASEMVKRLLPDLLKGEKQHELLDRQLKQITKLHVQNK